MSCNTNSDIKVIYNNKNNEFTEGCIKREKLNRLGPNTILDSLISNPPYEINLIYIRPASLKDTELSTAKYIIEYINEDPTIENLITKNNMTGEDAIELLKLADYLQLEKLQRELLRIILFKLRTLQPTDDIITNFANALVIDRNDVGGDYLPIELLNSLYEYLKKKSIDKVYDILIKLILGSIDIRYIKRFCDKNNISNTDETLCKNKESICTNYTQSILKNEWVNYFPEDFETCSILQLLLYIKNEDDIKTKTIKNILQNLKSGELKLEKMFENIKKNDLEPKDIDTLYFDLFNYLLKIGYFNVQNVQDTLPILKLLITSLKVGALKVYKILINCIKEKDIKLDGRVLCCLLFYLSKNALDSTTINELITITKAVSVDLDFGLTLTQKFILKELALNIEDEDVRDKNIKFLLGEINNIIGNVFSDCYDTKDIEAIYDCKLEDLENDLKQNYFTDEDLDTDAYDILQDMYLSYEKIHYITKPSEAYKLKYFRGIPADKQIYNLKFSDIENCIRKNL